MRVIEPFWREWREAWAARNLVLAVVDIEGGPLTNPATGSTPECRAVAVCDAVEYRLGLLARPPGPDDAADMRRLRLRLAQLARACGLVGKGGSDALVSTASDLWGDASQEGALLKRLEQRAPALAGFGGPVWLRRLIKDALWEAEASDHIATRQRRRNWMGVRAVSLEILPASDRDGERCTLVHFAAVAERIKRTRSHDRNLPRTVETVGELFYLFCPCCEGVADPTLPGGAGLVGRHDPDAVEGAAGEPDGDGVVPYPPDVETGGGISEGLAELMVAALKKEIAALPSLDQVVLSNLLGDLGILDRAGTRAAKLNYPKLDAEAVKSRDGTAHVLGITPLELADHRRRMDEWLGEMSRKLQHVPLSAEGAE